MPETNPNPDEPEKPDYPIYPPAIQQPESNAKPMTEKSHQRAKTWKDMDSARAIFFDGFAPVLLFNIVLLVLGAIVFNSLNNFGNLIYFLLVVCLLQIPIGIFANRRLAQGYNDANSKYVKNGVSWAIALTLLMCAFVFLLPGLLCGMALMSLSGYKNY